MYKNILFGINLHFILAFYFTMNNNKNVIITLAEWHVYAGNWNARKCILSESEMHDFENFLGEHALKPPRRALKIFLQLRGKKLF